MYTRLVYSLTRLQLRDRSAASARTREELVRRTYRECRARRLLLSLMVLCLSSLAGCDAFRRFDRVLYPTATEEAADLPQRAPVPSTPVARPSRTPTLAPAFTQPAPTHTAKAIPPVEPTSAPKPGIGLHLVFAQGGGIYRGDYLGREPAEVASVPQLEAWDFCRGVLAIARGGGLDIIDLNRGSLASYEAGIEGEVQFSQVLWSASGRSLLYAAVLGEETVPTLGRGVELRAIAYDGTVLGGLRIHDVTGVNLLRYDDAVGRVLVIPLGGDATFERADYYEPASGKLLDTVHIQGEGVAAVSPDGRLLLTECFPPRSGAQLALYDLTISGNQRPMTWQHPEATHSVSHIWSPDGRYLAYLLREGRSFSETTKGLGLWVLDVATMQARKVLEETCLSSSTVSWTPDGVYIMGHHRGIGGGSYFYVVRPDGGDRQILGLGPDAVVLGWMPPVKGPVPKVVVDPWRVRFLDSEGDPQALAQVVAEFVSAHPYTEEEELSRQVREYLLHSGWEIEPVRPTVKRVSEEVFLAQLPPASIYLIQEGVPSPIGSGHVIVDARLEGNQLGVVFGIVAGGALQPTYLVLRDSGAGTWGWLWTPQGQNDWITTDGEIRFVGEGLGTLQVSGTSFGIENRVFVECHACPHRRLVATWSRKGEAYVRQTNLPSDAPRDDVFWEMTQRTPYAVVYECLRRLRQGVPADELMEKPEVLDQIVALGLLNKELRLTADEETAEGVRFGDVEGKTRFHALVRDGLLVGIDRIES